MADGGRGTSPGLRSPQRPVVYCLIPAALAEELHAPLRDHYAGDTGIEVVVDRRGGERRSSVDRRAVEDEPGDPAEQRRIRSPAGRRVAERRATVMERDDAPALPAAAAGHVAELTFVERLEPSSEHAEEIDTARLVTAFQDGEQEAFTDLYIRYFDRVYAYLRMLLGDDGAAEAATHAAFVEVLDGLADYERGGTPFRAWLFAAVRRAALRELRGSEVGAVEDPLPEGSELERVSHEDDELHALRWVTDRDLRLLVEHLAPAQRQVLLLRYMLDLPSSEVAEVVGRSPEEVRELQGRALRLLRERLRELESANGEPEPDNAA
jgi:RNA polymerase sigma-70 factor, ECF subfamily